MKKFSTLVLDRFFLSKRFETIKAVDVKLEIWSDKQT